MAVGDHADSLLRDVRAAIQCFVQGTNVGAVCLVLSGKVFEQADHVVAAGSLGEEAYLFVDKPVLASELPLEGCLFCFV